MDVLLPSRARTATLLLRSPPLDEDDDELELIGWKNSNVWLDVDGKNDKNLEFMRIFSQTIKQKEGFVVE